MYEQPDKRAKGVGVQNAGGVAGASWSAAERPESARPVLAGAPHSFGKISVQAVAPAVIQAAREGRGPLQPPPEPAAEARGLRLPGTLQAKMEASLGQSFRDVRVHLSDAPTALGLKAYTRGANLHFANGAYDPRSHAGQELIGRQLSQLARQRQGGRGATMDTSPSENAPFNDPDRNDEADRAAERAAWGLPARLRRAAPPRF